MSVAGDVRHFSDPGRDLPTFHSGEAESLLLAELREILRRPGSVALDRDALQRRFAETRFPQHFLRLSLFLYAPGERRIVVTRARQGGRWGFAEVFERLAAHPRRARLAAGEFRLQLDFVVEPPQPVEYHRIGMSRRGARHFEIGLDGLLIHGGDGRRHLFSPGDAYVRSLMSMGQLRAYLASVHGEEYLRAARFECFRAASFLSCTGGWRPLYRGIPVVGPATRAKLERAVQLAVDHIRRTQQEDGRFLYYYDAATDSRRDHEHPGRDPDRNPYYNILRHNGGGLTCLFHERYTAAGDTLAIVRRAIDYLLAQLRSVDYEGRTGAYVYSERKSKLGGAGLALYLIAEYELVSGDRRYREAADRLAWHLHHQVTESGEFLYYNIYLDRPVGEAENRDHFSFYYPGEAVCGLARYLHLLPEAEREPYFARLERALEYLIRVRPRERAEEYTAVPSDAWLMMGIMELWDFAPMRLEWCAEFVFADAERMIAHMYKVSDAPYPDYAGAFYYDYGDYPYADGARLEGLLGAYALAAKRGERERMARLWPALRLGAWALLHLVNDEDAVYAARNPALALGGIRFKYTRQWFRIDTIQHVASFYAKLLPFWDEAEGAG